MILKPINNYRITSPYGWRTLRGNKEFHPGIDFGCAIGTEVFTPLDGVVKYAGNRDPQGFGPQVIIYHGQLPDGRRIYTQYAHLNFIATPIGTRVKAGQLIAKSGNGGRSFGAHLHFELRLSEFSDSGWVKKGAAHGQYHLDPAADLNVTGLAL
jgi:murein DD-endopeptidase MepM/ murein hydrolase activator NlpD